MRIRDLDSVYAVRISDLTNDMLDARSGWAVGAYVRVSHRSGWSSATTAPAMSVTDIGFYATLAAAQAAISTWHFAGVEFEPVCFVRT